jgi:hypothetical protein
MHTKVPVDSKALLPNAPRTLQLCARAVKSGCLHCIRNNSKLQPSTSPTSIAASSSANCARWHHTMQLHTNQQPQPPDSMHSRPTDCALNRSCKASVKQSLCLLLQSSDTTEPGPPGAASTTKHMHTFLLLCKGVNRACMQAPTAATLRACHSHATNENSPSFSPSSCHVYCMQEQS